METRDPIARLREIAATLDDAAASMSEHGFSIPSIRAKSIADEIEAQYIRLPVDSDGVPIRPGDEVGINPQSPTFYEVVAVGDGVVVLDGMFMRSADECRHVKPDTIFDILEELALRDDLGMLSVEAERDEMDELLARYAERIRKAVENG